ncbi:MAG: excisionase family DNA binding domain-containing [Prolixibacteraceae bacterium]|nr:MAG: excisionase family DNA binding domain-containing [Prolixibacteraceae bacterium]
MSTKIEVIRICQHCGKEFTARTTTTAYCSLHCNRIAYKAKQRAEKIEASNKETQRIKNLPIEELKKREFLTVTQVSKLISCSRQNVYSLINTGKLKATNILLKKTIVKRSDLDKLFKEPTNRLKTEGIPETQKQELKEWLQAGAFDIADCYSFNEVQDKYGISETALQEVIEQNSIPKIKKGWFAYVPKPIIDKLLS